jgi:hypothetical protein
VIMQKRTIIITLSVFSCLASLWLVAAQRQQLTALRSERLAAATAAETQPAQEEPSRPADQVGSTVGDPEATTSELLQLRSRVTQLSARVREMSSVTQENARLRGQLATAAQNAGTGIPLPSGYIRRAQAKQVGYRTPDDTLQSFFCALGKRDVTNLMAALTPAAAEKFQGLPHDDFFKGMEQIPGFCVKSREELPDGIVLLKIEIVPGMPAEPLRFQQVNGDWKLVMPF